jgi:hypothetical protein
MAFYALMVHAIIAEAHYNATLDAIDATLFRRFETHWPASSGFLLYQSTQSVYVECHLGGILHVVDR